MTRRSWRRQLMTLFQAEGDFEIRQARNGDEAVRENREFQPHVVTLDINMPEMDGLTALSLIMAESLLRWSWSPRSPTKGPWPHLKH